MPTHAAHGASGAWRRRSRLWWRAWMSTDRTSLRTGGCQRRQPRSSAALTASRIEAACGKSGTTRRHVSGMRPPVAKEKRSFFECFPYVCPEPVLVKKIAFIYKLLKRTVFSPAQRILHLQVSQRARRPRGGLSQGGHARQAQAVR